MPSREKLQKLLENEPDDVFLNFGLAMEMKKEGSFDDALAQFDRVIELDATYTAAFFQKGNTFIELGRIEEATSTLQRGVEAARQIGNTHAAGEMQEVIDHLQA